MKRAFLYAFVIMVVCCGVASAQTAVTLEEVTNIQDDSLLTAGETHHFKMRATNIGSGTNYNFSNGFEVFSPDGAEWSYPERDTTIKVIIPGEIEDTTIDSILVLAPNFALYFPVKYGRLYFSPDGMGADTLAYFGAGDAEYLGLVQGHDILTWDIPIQSRLEDNGKHICIDSAWYPPGGTWKWAPLSTGYEQIAPDWSGQECFKVFNPDAPKMLQLSDESLTFGAVEGGPNPDPQDVTVSEAGGATIAFTAAESPDVNWLSLTDPSGMTEASFGVNIDLDNAGSPLGEGTYTANIEVSSPDADPVQVAVELNVAAGPKYLEVSRSTVSITAVEAGANPSPEAVTVSETGGASIPFIAAEAPDVDWLTLSGASQMTPNDFMINIDMYGGATPLGPGMHYATISVSSVDAEGPVEVAVELEVTPRPKFLEATPPVLNVSAVEGGADPATIPVMIEEISDAAIDFAVSTEAAWISVVAVAPLTPNIANVDIHIDGLSAGMHTDSIKVTSTEADSIYIVVNLDISDRPTLVADPNSFLFTPILEGHPIPTQTFDLTMSDGSVVLATVATDAAWIDLGAVTEYTTPAVVSFDISLLPPGEYADSIFVDGPESLDAIWVYVTLEVTARPRGLVVDPTTLDFMANEGDVTVPGQTFDVSESEDDEIDFEASTEATWIVLSNNTGNTPGTVNVDVNKAGLAPGDYYDSVMVASTQADEDAWVMVSLSITPCPVLTLDTGLFIYTVGEGETLLANETVELTSSASPVEIEWLADAAPYFILDPTTETTPTSIDMTYERTFDASGTFDDTVRIAAVPVPGNECTSEVIVIVQTLVTSADTLIVETVPGVPGMEVTVPVNFASKCDLLTLSGSMAWDPTYLHFDSLSYEESALLGYDLTETVEPELGTAIFEADVFGGSSIPGGSGYNWFKLHFTISSDAPAGTYPFTLPAIYSEVTFVRDCAGEITTEIPEVVPGYINVGISENHTCGWVMEPDSVTPIPGATVEFWTDFPTDGPITSTISTGIGSFADTTLLVPTFDVWAYKEGYYPGKVEDLGFQNKGYKVILTPIPETVVPTPSTPNNPVDYYCETNTYLDAPLPVGSVIEVRVSNEYGDNLLVGQGYVTVAGSYGFLPVYREFPDNSEPGAKTDNTLRFYVNGMPAAATGELDYPAGYEMVEVCLEAGMIPKECDLVVGWNLVSWNVDTESDAIVDLFAGYMEDIDVILGFEQGGLTYAPDLPQFSTLWECDHLSGYWVKVTEPFTLTLQGFQITPGTGIPLNPGWNLVSYLPQVAMPPEEALVSIEDHLIFAYGFDGLDIQIYQPGGGFNDPFDMGPCNGYFVKVDAEGTLYYPDGSVPPATSSWTRPTLASAASLGSRLERTTSWVNLYSSDLKLNGRTVDAGAVITAHAETDGSLVGRFTLDNNGEFGFMPVYAGNGSALSQGESFYLAVDGIDTDERFEWSGNGDRIEVLSLSAANAGGANLPISYGLEQNYPNPFNPSTAIPFRMPSSGNAKVEVFNILGKLIATPFDGPAVAGENSVIWDGRNSAGESVASGVYLYRLTADNYSETKKMMLLK